MKQLKRKDLALEHYRLAIQATVNVGTDSRPVAVSVWKPRTMEQLPAYKMRSFIEYTAGDLNMYYDPKAISGPKDPGGACWVTRNPDYGIWDAQVVCRMDYRQQKVDIYICALLMRPFSEEARHHYEHHCGLQPFDRMMLLWDSRQYDREHQCKPVNYVKFSKNSQHRSYNELYLEVNPREDIAEGRPKRQIYTMTTREQFASDVPTIDFYRKHFDNGDFKKEEIIRERVHQLYEEFIDSHDARTFDYNALLQVFAIGYKLAQIDTNNIHHYIKENDYDQE